ncbi:MAG: cupin domain-containing protein [Candidatus Komeilibacteria bacterium]|nr:cupin domain-containing protein [Candidatus Komeilibacteria bacterium]
MNYRLEKADIKEKFGIRLNVYPEISEGCGVVIVNTEEGHNQEFYDKKSTFTYLILEGQGTYFLNDEEVQVAKGDLLSIEPGTRIYYKGKMKMVLITTPAWRAENEVETKPNVW